jgi:hypothetical protein
MRPLVYALAKFYGEKAVSNADDVHILDAILYADRRLMRFLRSFFLITLLLMGLLGLRFAFLSLAPPGVYMKDFIQEYLLGRAAREGVNPYSPLPVLADQFIGSLDNLIFPHPTPHPPPVILLSLPFAFFSYQTAALLWLIFEILCLGLSRYIIAATLGKRVPLWLIIFILILIVGWRPVVDGLVVGQLMSLLLLLLCATWALLRVGYWKTAAACLGAAAALKLVVWPVALLLLFYRRWQALIVLAFVFVAANLLAGLIIDLEVLIFYYTSVGAGVEAMYRSHEDNFSIWSIGWRLFDGVGSTAVHANNTIIGGIQAPPLIYWPEIAPYVSLALLILFLLLIAAIVWRAKTLDAAFAVLVGAAVIANPIAWSHYLILLIIPITVAGRCLLRLGLPRQETNWGILLSLLLFLPRFELNRLTRLFVTDGSAASVSPTTPFAAGLLGLIPLLAVLGLLFFIWRLDQNRVSGSST